MTEEVVEQTEAEPNALEVGDLVPADLRAWGLSGEPASWAFVNWQPLVAAIRSANTGTLTAAEVQPILDATFPDAGYDAADIVIAHPPTATFTATVGEGDTDLRLDLDGDADLGLPNENVEWDVGDGTPVIRDASGVDHTYAAAGTYRVTLSVLVAGSITQTSEDYVVGSNIPPVLGSLDPPSAALGGEDITLRVLGTGFDESSIIVFNGGDEATAFVSDSELTTGVQPSTASVAGTFPVQVRDPGGLSNALGFDFTGVSFAADESAAVDEFDPGKHTVDEVLAYAADHPDEVDAIIAAEDDGKGRVGILDKL